MFLVQAQDMVTRLANILRYSLQRERNHKVPLETELEVVSDSRVSSKRRESQSQVSAEANKMPSRCVLFNLYYRNM
jgi:LytS/YehU family sensor histidine kinase